MAQVIVGEDKQLTIRIISESSDEPYDLSSATEVTVCFEGHTSTVTKNTSSGVTILSPEELGKITVDLDDTDTQALKTGTINFEVTIDAGTDRKIVQFKKQLQVIERLCS